MSAQVAVRRLPVSRLATPGRAVYEVVILNDDGIPIDRQDQEEYTDAQRLAVACSLTGCPTYIRMGDRIVEVFRGGSIAWAARTGGQR